MAEAENRPLKKPKVDINSRLVLILLHYALFQIQQNHTVEIIHIDPVTMEHFCNVTIHPDKLNPRGMIKKGIKIGHNEFNKGNLF